MGSRYYYAARFPEPSPIETQIKALKKANTQAFSLSFLLVIVLAMMDSATASARYDRQIRVWGKEAQARLMTARVLIAGLTGLNMEVAKNLALAGVNVTLQDDQVASPSDIGVNFFLTAEHIGR